MIGKASYDILNLYPRMILFNNRQFDVIKSFMWDRMHKSTNSFDKIQLRVDVIYLRVFEKRIKSSYTYVS